MGEEVVQHEHRHPDDRVKVKLIKNSRGYGWELTVTGANFVDVCAEVDSINSTLTRTYGAREEGE